MTENSEHIREVIDTREIFGKLLRRKKLFVINLVVAFVISSALILCVPRYYVCSVKLAPETGTNNLGSIGSLASNFGIDLSSQNGQDAIYPTLYPDLMESVDFQVGMFPVSVETIDGEIHTNYYDYLNRHHKRPWWSVVVGSIKKLFEQKDENETKTSKGVNPFRLTKKQTDIAGIINNNINCTVDKRTDVITITVLDQDPLVCATLADSVRVKLQDFITDYRTSKARVDLEYYTRLANEAKVDYEEIRKVYAKQADANADLILIQYKTKVEDLENEMQLRYNVFTAMNSQLQMAKAKVQERTPAFTVIQGATVPQKPAGPKRVLFVVAMMFLTFMGTIVYVFKKDILAQLKIVK